MERQWRCIPSTVVDSHLMIHWDLRFTSRNVWWRILELLYWNDPLTEHKKISPWKKAMKVHRGSRGEALTSALDGVGRTTPHLCHSLSPHVGTRAGLDGCRKPRTPPPGFDPRDHPGRSDSLYRLSYPDPLIDPSKTINPLKPNDPYRGRTAPLTF